MPWQSCICLAVRVNLWRDGAVVKDINMQTTAKPPQKDDSRWWLAPSKTAAFLDIDMRHDRSSLNANTLCDWGLWRSSWKFCVCTLRRSIVPSAQGVAHVPQTKTGTSANNQRIIRRLSCVCVKIRAFVCLSVCLRVFFVFCRFL